MAKRAPGAIGIEKTCHFIQPEEIYLNLDVKITWRLTADGGLWYSGELLIWQENTFS
ncbi:hypothetical protein LQT98_14925 [Chromobacterium aquaticum]|uniref:Uncharacterized protein n=1 Tax=Chromobacterium aquaticum TaxID=467180 RepID=A0ABV8ZM64_9NEIS|nr:MULTISPECIES: hypothetical protein [Chromobacterium]MCD5362980.1 hypothetical protein [Chromobacterium aquaticum]